MLDNTISDLIDHVIAKKRMSAKTRRRAKIAAAAAAVAGGAASGIGNLKVAREIEPQHSMSSGSTSRLYTKRGGRILGTMTTSSTKGRPSKRPTATSRITNIRIGGEDTKRLVSLYSHKNVKGRRSGSISVHGRRGIIGAERGDTSYNEPSFQASVQRNRVPDIRTVEYRRDRPKGKRLSYTVNRSRKDKFA